jgi:flagellar basal body-associated protein FliL
MMRMMMMMMMMIMMMMMMMMMVMMMMMIMMMMMLLRAETAPQARELAGALRSDQGGEQQQGQCQEDRAVDQAPGPL